MKLFLKAPNINAFGGVFINKHFCIYIAENCFYTQGAKVYTLGCKH